MSNPQHSSSKPVIHSHNCPRKHHRVLHFPVLLPPLPHYLDHPCCLIVPPGGLARAGICSPEHDLGHDLDHVSDPFAALCLVVAVLSDHQCTIYHLHIVYQLICRPAFLESVGMSPFRLAMTSLGNC